ncbi:MAG TPA: DNA translocase FtsK, partial [Chloroflexi bacterium]|nr:DNA translocase FtsK [Chloroflexota bacterium]
QLPPLTLLKEPEGPALTDEEIRRKSNIIQKTLAQFGVPVEITEVRVGPAVTQFGVTPGYVERRDSNRKIRVNQISTLSDDLALALAAPRIRVEAPVPGRPYVGIEVPNSNVQTVSLREVMESEDFQKINSALAVALGHNVAGDPVAADLSTMPHLLIAGTTGSGKSVCIKALTTCLVYNNSPDKLRLVMIDPKMVELMRFNGLPHLYGHVEVDLERVVKVLRWVAWEMDARYKRFAKVAARNIDEYNQLARDKDEAPYPRIVVLIDELSDLMMLAPEEVERTICRIAQMARATGIHLVVATQRPSTDVVTGLIKANFPARISFATVSQTDSRVILDMSGAETLIGQGDMLYLSADAGYPVRLQGCYVSEDETDHVVRFWREQVGFTEQQAPWERLLQKGVLSDSDEDGDETDDLLEEAIELVQESGNASASLLQRKLRIGHPRAARLMKLMEEMDVIGPPVQAGRSRRVIIGEEEDQDA